MILKVQDLKKAEVITHNGQKLSSIKNILYDPSEKRVIALVTSKPTMMSGAKVIQLENVERMSSEAIIVGSEEAERKAAEVDPKIDELTKDKKLRLESGKIIGDDATEYGSLSDVFIDSENGNVIGFELSQGKVKDIKEGKKTMKVTDIISVGDDAIIVKPKLTNDNQPPTPKKEGQSIQVEKKPNGSMPAQEQKLAEPDPKKVQDAVGKYLAKNILTPDDRLFAKQGDIVTNDLVQAAYTNGLLEQVLQNVTTKQTL